MQQGQPLLDDLLGAASHDLRTPLTSLRLQSALLAGDLDPGPRAQAAAILQRNLRRLELLVDDFADLVRLESGALALRPGPLDLAAVARAAAESFEAEAEERRVRLDLDLPASLPATADERRATQAVATLLAHALRRAPEGSAVRVTGAMGPAHVELAVTDAGPAPEPMRPVGLGLPLARQMAERQGGALRIEGGTATLRLPRA